MVTRSSFAVFASALGLALSASGCGTSLEEACQDYCEALAEADCENSPELADCQEQCDQAEEQLGGKCEDEYTDTLDCAADEEIVCDEGNPQLASANCAEEAFELLQCLDEEGVLDGDDETVESGGSGG